MTAIFRYLIPAVFALIALTALSAPELSYSHSDGRVVGNAAMVRFNWVGEQQAVSDGSETARR
jgi:hypothetical protein